MGWRTINQSKYSVSIITVSVDF